MIHSESLTAILNIECLEFTLTAERCSMITGAISTGLD
jgi:hypothetical protein